jgi:hypothetical protein
MVTFYHFDVVGILTSEEDFHREKLGKIYYSVYEHHCRALIIRGQAFLCRCKENHQVHIFLTGVHDG